VVVGQTDFTSGDANQGGTAPAANTINAPYGNPGANNGVLYLPDYGNERLLGYNAIPSVNNMNADFVLGQVDFTSDVNGVSATAFNGTQTVFLTRARCSWSHVDEKGYTLRSIVAGDRIRRKPLVHPQRNRPENIHLAEELIDNIDAPIFINIDAGGEHVAAGDAGLAALPHKHQ